MKHSKSLSHLRQLCALGLSAEAIMPALLRSIRRFVPCGSGAFSWVDARGDMTQLYAELMLPAAATARYFRAHYENTERAFRDRLMAQVQAGEVVRETVVNDETLASVYYREILEPLGAYRLLHAVPMQQGLPLGQLSLYRARGMPEFSKTERELVETACRYLVPALRSDYSEGGGTNDNYRDSGQAALLVCDTDGRVRQASGRGHALLAQASGCRINRQTIVSELEQAGIALIRRVLARYAAGEEAAGDFGGQLRVANEWGRFRLRAYALDDGYGVLIERHEHLLIRLVDAMHDLGLSDKQREVALNLARGLTNPQIARAMNITLNTVSFHVKELFGKLDAHDRAEVIARVLSGHTTRD